MTMFLVYALVDPRDGQRFYVGQSSKGLARPKQHTKPTSINAQTPKAAYLRRLAAAGLRPVIEVLQYIDDPDASMPVPLRCWTGADFRALDAAEMWWIAHGQATGWPLTNYTHGGDGVRGAIFTTEHRANMSKAATGRKKAPFTDEHRAKISKAMTGKRKSPEHIVKVAMAITGRAHAPEHTAKIAAANTGKPFDADERARISEAVKNSPRAIAQRVALAMSQTGKKRRPWTEAQKERLRFLRPSRRGIPISPEHRANIVIAKQRTTVGRQFALLIAGLAFPRTIR